MAPNVDRKDTEMHKLIVARGVKRSFICRKANISKDDLYRFEYGKRWPDWDTIVRIASALRCDPKEIINELADEPVARGMPGPRPQKRLPAGTFVCLMDEWLKGKGRSVTSLAATLTKMGDEVSRTLLYNWREIGPPMDRVEDLSEIMGVPVPKFHQPSPRSIGADEPPSEIAAKRLQSVCERMLLGHTQAINTAQARRTVKDLFGRLARRKRTPISQRKPLSHSEMFIALVEAAGISDEELGRMTGADVLAKLQEIDAGAHKDENEDEE